MGKDDKIPVNFCVPACLATLIPGLDMGEAARELKYDPSDGCKLGGLEKFLESKGYSSWYVPANMLEEYEFAKMVRDCLKSGKAVFVGIDGGAVPGEPKGRHFIRVVSVNPGLERCDVVTPRGEDPALVRTLSADDLYVASRRCGDGITVAWRKQ